MSKSQNSSPQRTTEHTEAQRTTGARTGDDRLINVFHTDGYLTVEISGEKGEKVHHCSLSPDVVLVSAKCVVMTPYPGMVRDDCAMGLR